MSKRRLTASLLCLTVCLSSQLIAWADTITEQENAVRDAGITVNWLDFGVQHQGATILYPEEDTPLYAIELIQDYEQGISKYGFVNGSGQTVIPFEYDMTYGFNGGTAYVQKGSNKYYVDPSGNVVLDVSQYDQVADFYDSNYASVYIEGQGYGLMDRQGNLVIPCSYSYVYAYDDGYAQATDASGGKALFDESGNQLTGFEYESIGTAGTDGIRMVTKANRYGYISKEGKEIIPPAYEDANSFSEGLASVKVAGKWGYIDTEGNTVIQPLYYYGSHFNGGAARVHVSEDEVIYIDRNGQKTEETSSTSSQIFSNGMRAVSKTVQGLYVRDAVRDGGVTFGPETYTLQQKIYTHSVVDENDSVVIGPKQYYLSYLGEGIYGGTHDDLEGTGITPPNNYTITYALLDEAGNRFTSFGTARAGDFKNGIAPLYERAPSRMRGVINKNGTVIVPTLFSELYVTGDRQCLVELGGYIDADGYHSKVGFLQLPEDAATRPNPEPKPIPVIINGIEIYFDSEPEIIEGRTMVPVRKIFEVLGAYVNWEEETQTVKSSNNIDMTMELTIGSDEALINGEAVALDAPALIHNGRTLVPLRTVAEAFGADVKWDDETFSVIITIE